MNRLVAIDQLSNYLLSCCGESPLLVAIDGVDGSGKTTIGSELKCKLEGSVPTFSISIDEYHHPKAMRYRKDRSSPVGFYRDSYDYDAFMIHVIRALKQGEPPCYTPRYFDLGTNTKVMCNPVFVPRRSVILIDGIFLQRQELENAFDVVVFVDASFDETLGRMLVRDTETTDNDQETIEMFNIRYKPGQELYLGECNPRERADVVFNNNVLNEPIVHINSVNKTLHRSPTNGTGEL